MDVNLILLAVVATAALALSSHLKRSSWRKASAATGSAARGKPTLYYFWTPTCAECRASQGPVVDRIGEAARGGIEIVRVNVGEEVRTARSFGIWTVPTTVVVGSDGAVRDINTGLVGEPTLRNQLGFVASTDTLGQSRAA